MNVTNTNNNIVGSSLLRLAIIESSGSPPSSFSHVKCAMELAPLTNNISDCFVTTSDARQGRPRRIVASSSTSSWSACPLVLRGGRPALVPSLLVIVVLFGVTMWSVALDETTAPPHYHPTSVNDERGVPTVAFCGNSMLYYNDCPRLVEILLTRMYYYDDNVTTTSTTPRLQDSCLRGGASLASLWERGNGMQTRFGGSVNNGVNSDHARHDHDDIRDDIGAPTVASLLQNPPWDTAPNTARNSRSNNSSNSSSNIRACHTRCGTWNYILLQDHELCTTQTTEDGRPVSLRALREHYLPSIQNLSKQHRQPPSPPPPPTVLLMETFAYQTPRLRETIGLGGMEEFTSAIVVGIEEYASVVQDFGLEYRVIPMATAVEALAKAVVADGSANPTTDLWKRIYDRDGVHPSPHGAWLQACLIVSIVTGRVPPPVGRRAGRNLAGTCSTLVHGTE